MPNYMVIHFNGTRMQTTDLCGSHSVMLNRGLCWRVSLSRCGVWGLRWNAGFCLTGSELGDRARKGAALERWVLSNGKQAERPGTERSCAAWTRHGDGICWVADGVAGDQCTSYIARTELKVGDLALIVTVAYSYCFFVYMTCIAPYSSLLGRELCVRGHMSLKRRGIVIHTYQNFRT